jgi:ATP-binding cassette subfamily B protein
MSTTLVQPSKEPFKRLFAYLAPEKREFNKAIGNSFINKLLDLAPPVLVGWAVDTAMRNPPEIVSMIGGSSVVGQGATLAALAIFIFGFESYFQWLFTTGFMRVAQNLQHRLRLDAYSKMQSREMAFFEDHRVGETMSMLSDDVNQLERFINSVFYRIVEMISLFIIAPFIMLAASPTLSLIAILPLPLIVWGSLKFQNLLNPKYKKVREAVAWVNTRLENNLGGISVIKAFTAESFELERLKEVSSKYRDVNIEAIKLSALFVPLIRMGISLGFAAVLGFGLAMTIEGTMTVGEFTLFGMMSQRILWPLVGLGDILNETSRCRASSERIFGLLDTPATIQDDAQAVSLDESQGDIEFASVRFRYSRGNDILQGLSFHVKAGETIGIAGATGAGKSTLIKLLFRMYDPTQGQILLDGTPLTKIKMASLRKNIALVSQDVYLFQGTIRENISYGLNHTDLDQVIEAAKMAQLHDFVSELADGYETMVGERGIKLSGGQRQRLSIARAILKNAPILVLDEATSSVDTETERHIQTGINKFARGRTAVIIAHRLSTIRKADRILVLEHGVLAEEGTHDALVAKGGVYSDLWRLQSGDL